MFHYVYYSYEEFGRGYIGSRTCKCPPDKDVTYFGSYTEENFFPTGKVILEEFQTAEESLLAEGKLMDFYQVKDNPHFVNKQRSPFSPVTCKGRVRHPEEVRKTKETLKKFYSNPEKRQKLSEQSRGENNGMFGKTPWNKGKSGPETKKGVPKPPGFSEKISEANRRRGPLSEETKRKISESQKRRLADPEVKRRLSKVKRQVSDETRRKMSESAKIRCQRQKINNKKDKSQ